jgi:hypothetical protein
MNGTVTCPAKQAACFDFIYISVSKIAVLAVVNFKGEFL